MTPQQRVDLEAVRLLDMTLAALAKRCMSCGAKIDWSTCPGHAGATGIEDHCRSCVEAGLCPAIAQEFVPEDYDACAGPCIVVVDGYPETG